MRDWHGALALRHGRCYIPRMANVSPLKYSRPFNMRVDDEFVAAVKELQRLDPDVPNKSDTIRRAVMNELERKRREKRK
jgi:hypothetical protein